jgi:hypothetical protein
MTFCARTRAPPAPFFRSPPANARGDEVGFRSLFPAIMPVFEAIMRQFVLHYRRDTTLTRYVATT